MIIRFIALLVATVLFFCNPNYGKEDAVSAAPQQNEEPFAASSAKPTPSETSGGNDTASDKQPTAVPTTTPTPEPAEEPPAKPTTAPTPEPEITQEPIHLEENESEWEMF